MVKSKFLLVTCPRCGTRRIIFGKASSVIKCLKCNKRLNNPTGGKTKIKARVRKQWN